MSTNQKKLTAILITSLLLASIVVYAFNQKMEPVTKGPENGSLIVIGGAAKAAIFYEKFAELAGGFDSEIVLIPTAAGEEYLSQDPGFENLKTQFSNKGFTKISVLHTTDPKEANDPDFYKALETATGVWITGGRQWRLADSYLGTKTLETLKGVLVRGGVISGSSAGATIQGSYLARGDTKTNTIMMGDHEEGFGFISNIAIDQHLLKRNRQFDIFDILDNRPELLGIGLDENTGVLVRGNQFEVIGESYVAIYDGKMWSDDTQAYRELPIGSREFYFLNAGMRYDMAKREKVLKN
ncbi:MAG: cyanophycinase [Saprospiraceae bacterium]|jgi:cyanophycinase